MTAGDWFFLALCTVELACLGLFVWGERRAEKYFDDLDARVEKLRADRLANGGGL